VTEPGILEEAYAPSESVPGKIYRMVRSAGGWQHADLGCEAWVNRGACRHVEGMNMQEDGETTTALAVIDGLEDTAIVARITGQMTAEWVYRFSVGGKDVVGLSVDGVEAAARECAKMGEAIRELDVRVEYEDENEARFVARAGRYVVGLDGSERLLDVAIRAKRQPKVIHLRTGATQADEFWYEKGVAKAVRNAKEALLPEAAKTLILAEAEKVGRVRQVGANPASRGRAPLVKASPGALRSDHPEAAPEQKAAAEAVKESGAEPSEPDMPNLRNLGDLYNAAIKRLGYKDKGTVLATLECPESQIADLPAAWRKLVAKAQA
jgi:hypothetical protein